MAPAGWCVGLNSHRHGYRGSPVGLLLAQILVGSSVVGVLCVAMLAEAFPAAVRSFGVGLTAGFAMALIGGTAHMVEPRRGLPMIVTMTAAEAVPGVDVAVIGSLALLPLWRWPETAFLDLS